MLAKQNTIKKTFYSLCIIDWSSAQNIRVYLVLLLPFYKISTKESLGVRKPKDGHLSWPWCFCNEEKRKQRKSHLTAAAGNDAIKKLFPTPEHFCANTKQLLTRLGYRTVENSSIVASHWIMIVFHYSSLFLCVFLSLFFVYLSIENLPFTIQSRSDDKSDSKSCDITTNPLLSNETMSIAFSSLLLILWWNFSFIFIDHHSFFLLSK